MCERPEGAGPGCNSEMEMGTQTHESTIAHPSLVDALARGACDYRDWQRRLAPALGAVGAARAIAQARAQAAAIWQDWQPADDAPDATTTRTTKRMAREREALRDPAFDPAWDTRKCPQCGKVFRVTASNATRKQYCSAACSNAARQARHRAALAASVTGE